METVVTMAEKLANIGPKALPLLVIPVAFLVSTWFAFTLRVYVRAFMIRSFGWDDWMMLLTLLMYTTCCGLLITVEQTEHSDKPRKAIKAGPLASLALEEEIMKYIITLMGLYILTTVTLKISLAIFFLRVVVKGWQRWVIYVTVSVYTTFGVFFAFLAIFQCGNPNDMLISEANGKCLPNSVLQPLNYTHGALNAASDWIMALLPILVLAKSNIPRPTKISAGLLLLLGALGSISSLIRLKYIPGLKSSSDFFNNAIDIAVWSSIEPGLGIVAASLATLRPLFRIIVEKSRSASSDRSNTEDPIHSAKMLARHRARYSGPDRGYLPMDDKPRVMGNFSSVVGDMKSTPRAQTYELEEMGQTTTEQKKTTTSSSRSSTDPDINKIQKPATIGSLQNKAWFPDDEVLMTRQIAIYDEEAGIYDGTLQHEESRHQERLRRQEAADRQEQVRRYEDARRRGDIYRYEESRRLEEERRRREEARRNVEAGRYLQPRR